MSEGPLNHVTCGHPKPGSRQHFLSHGFAFRQIFQAHVQAHVQAHIQAHVHVPEPALDTGHP